MQDINLEEKLVDINTELNALKCGIDNTIFTIKQIIQDADIWTIDIKMDYILELDDNILERKEKYKNLYREKKRLERMLEHGIDCRAEERYDLAR